MSWCPEEDRLLIEAFSFSDQLVYVAYTQLYERIWLPEAESLCALLRDAFPALPYAEASALADHLVQKIIQRGGRFPLSVARLARITLRLDRSTHGLILRAIQRYCESTPRYDI